VLWDNYYGVDISEISTYNIIRGNDINSSEVGVRFHDRRVSNNIVCANNITSAYTGLFYYFTGSNYVVGNYIVHNAHATHFVDSRNNVLHHNNFVNNSRDISEDSSYHDDIRIGKSTNIWDESEEGNYWSAYNGTGNNGIGTTPYVLNEFNQDNYPLLQTVDVGSYASYSSTTLPSPSPSPSPSISPSPTQQPTPSPTLSDPDVLGDPPVDYTPTYIMLGILTITIALCAVAYFYFGNKQTRKTKLPV
jgi:hypothetical protein